MPKANSNGNHSGSTLCQPTVHLILQGKGGGKSVIASWLAEFLIQRGQPVCCIDGDPVNRSFGQYKVFPVEKLELVDASGVLQRNSYDALVDRFVQEDAVFAVHSGATAFLHSGPTSSKPIWWGSLETPRDGFTFASRLASGNADRHLAGLQDHRGDGYGSQPGRVD